MDYAHENQRMRTMDAYNLRLPGTNILTDTWEMPIIFPEHEIPDDLIGFNYAMSSKNTDCGVHFFIDDYQFERVWRLPERYVERMSQYQVVCTPDFSTYRDMPRPMQLWNMYRSRVIGSYWQTYGVTVIPTLQWAGVESLEYAFDGLPHHSTLAVTTLGVRDDKQAEALWRAGMGEALRQLEPETILLHGTPLDDFDWHGTQVHMFTDHMRERLEKLNGRKRK